MSTFKVDNQQVNDSVEILKKLLEECEEAYNQEIPESTIDKGLAHAELDQLCANLKTTSYNLGQLIHNTILFLGESSDMFKQSDKESATAISDYTSGVAFSSAVTVSTKNYTTGTISVAPTNVVDVGNYTSKVTDTEYARLCYLAGKIKGEEHPEVEFVNLLVGDLPENDPLKEISVDQVSVVQYGSGFSAITISDGDTAIVIFAGTDGDAGDYIADAQLTLSLPASEQSKQAANLINNLSKEHSNIVVTGHSLGGFLATSVTLQNDTVSQCVAFDPPGRYDVEQQIMNHPDRVDKVTTYEANGSRISSVGNAVGDVKKLDVEENGGWFLGHNHGIKQICKAMGGIKTIKNSWT